MHLLSPIFTAAAISSVALHGHADHLHSSCSNIYSQSLTHKPRHQRKGVQQGGGSEGGDDEGLQSRNSAGTNTAGQEKTVSEGALR